MKKSILWVCILTVIIIAGVAFAGTHIGTCTLSGVISGGEGLAVYGSDASGDITIPKVTVTFSDDLRLTCDASGLPKRLFGGAMSGSLITVSGDTELEVIGNSNARMDVTSGGILFYGGNASTNPCASSISGNSKLTISGPMPNITPCTNEEYGVYFYGGSGSDGGGSDTINGNSTLNITGAWNIPPQLDEGNYQSWAFGGSWASRSADVTVKGKSTVILDNADAKICDLLGGGQAHRDSTSRVLGGTFVFLYQGNVDRVLGGGKATKSSASIVSGDTVVRVRNASGYGVWGDSKVLGGGSAGSSGDVAESCPYSEVSGNTYIYIEPDSASTGNGFVYIFGGGLSRFVAGAKAIVKGSTNIILSGDKALQTISPIVSGQKTFVNAGGLKQCGPVLSGDVKGDGNITLQNITDLSKLPEPATLNGQGRERASAERYAPQTFYNDSVLGTSRLFFDNVKGSLKARTVNFDEITFKNGSEIVAESSLSQLVEPNDKAEAVKVTVEPGSTLKVAKDATIGTLILNGTLEVADGVAFNMNNGMTKGPNGKIVGKGSMEVKLPESVKTPFTPANSADIEAKVCKTETNINALPEKAREVAEVVDDKVVVSMTKTKDAINKDAQLKAKYNPDKMKGIPVFRGDTTKTLLISLKTTLNDFAEKKFSDFRLLKVTADGSFKEFTQSATPAAIAGGQFIITALDGTAVKTDEKPTAGKEYLVNIAVKDQSDYDVN
ncbi:MAG: hypothetical protein Q4F74_05250, partial [Synergistaceae bacterium]|nr:hypothetical protein [Synergistaceae bacterium]